MDLLGSSWIILGTLPLFFFLGYWGGVLQHSHLSAGDGGNLQDYLPTPHRNVLGTDILGSITPNDITVTIPGGTLALNKTIRVTVLGEFLNNTGLAQVPPQIDLGYGAAGSECILFPATTIGSHPNRRMWRAQWFISAQNSNLLRSVWMDIDFSEFSGSVIVPVLSQNGGRSPFSFPQSFNNTIDQPMRLRVVNQVNNAQYGHRVNCFHVDVL